MVFIRYSSNIVMHVVVQNHTTTCLTVTALLISVVFVMQSSGGGYQIRGSGSQWGSRAKPRWGKSPEAEAFLLILNNFFKPCHLNLFIGFGDVLVSLKIVYL